jgi:hypothetical protein
MGFITNALIYNVMLCRVISGYDAFCRTPCTLGGAGMPRIIREQLTLPKVKNARPEAKLYPLRDSAVPGLLLRVAPGRKAWAITWARGQERVIGPYLS